jgi:hypothetical protein
VMRVVAVTESATAASTPASAKRFTSRVRPGAAEVVLW